MKTLGVVDWGGRVLVRDGKSCDGYGILVCGRDSDEGRRWWGRESQEAASQVYTRRVVGNAFVVLLPQANRCSYGRRMKDR